MNNNLIEEYNKDKFLIYVKEPEKIFELEVEKKYQNLIVPIFESKNMEAKKIIYDNILILSKLIGKLNH